MTKPLSLRAYASHRRREGLDGGTLRAVQEAVANGRLATSLTKDGKIRSAVRADKEWAASTKSDHVPVTGPAASRNTEVADSRGGTSNPFAEARARREAAQAELRELELAKQRGELIPAKDFDAYLERVEQRMKATFTRCRDRLLALPSRARQRDPSLSARHMTLLEALVRDILVELAAGETAATSVAATTHDRVEDARAG